MNTKANQRAGFILIKESIVNNILGPYSGDEFDLIGYPKQTKDAESISQKSLVQVFFTRSQINWQKTATKGNFIHDVTYQVDVTVAVSSRGDVKAMLDPAALPADKIKALSKTLNATHIADSKIDDLYELIISILRAPKNSNLGMEPKIVKIGTMRPEQFAKNDPLEEGGLVVCTSSLLINCEIPEFVSGEEGILSNKTLVNTFDIKQDPEQKTGTKINTQ